MKTFTLTRCSRSIFNITAVDEYGTKLVDELPVAIQHDKFLNHTFLSSMAAQKRIYKFGDPRMFSTQMVFSGRHVANAKELAVGESKTYMCENYTCCERL
jgi:hypothetical protein